MNQYPVTLATSLFSFLTVLDSEEFSRTSVSCASITHDQNIQKRQIASNIMRLPKIMQHGTQLLATTRDKRRRNSKAESPRAHLPARAVGRSMEWKAEAGAELSRGS